LKELFPSIELERKLKEFDGVLNAKALISYQEVDEVLYKVLNSFKDFADDC
jgi:type III secretory pathway lipoprotein EscJ